MMSVIPVLTFAGCSLTVTAVLNLNSTFQRLLMGGINNTVGDSFTSYPSITLVFPIHHTYH